MSSVAIKNAKVFDGNTMAGVKTVVFENGIIVDQMSADMEFDGAGCTLLPGLFDCHIHLGKTYYLEMAARHGITTMLDCGTRDVDLIHRQLNLPGLPHILSSYPPAFGPNSTMRTRMLYSDLSMVKDIEDVPKYVGDRVRNGADFIKVILEIDDNQGGADFPDDILAALVWEAHKFDKKIYAHATTTGAYIKGAKAGVDILTHMPFDRPIPLEALDNMVKYNITVIPTLVMMEGILSNLQKHVPNFPKTVDAPLKNLSAMRQSGIKVLAGTDSNLDDKTTPFDPCHGPALHRELGLMIQAGYTNVEVLRSATADPAKYFGLSDRGIIEPGKRADLLLVQGDPTEDIERIRNVRKVWIDGKPAAV